MQLHYAVRMMLRPDEEWGYIREGEMEREAEILQHETDRKLVQMTFWKNVWVDDKNNKSSTYLF